MTIRSVVQCRAAVVYDFKEIRQNKRRYLDETNEKAGYKVEGDWDLSHF